MNYSLVFSLSCILSLAGTAHAAEAQCGSFSDESDDQGDILLALQSEGNDDRLLQVDFEEASYCFLQHETSSLEGQASAAIHVNTALDELAIQATIEGVDIWLRIDGEFSDLMLLDRDTSDGLGLLDAEFLGDNSLLEASDFFVEYLDSLALGEFEIPDVEVNIPRLDAAYDHYAGRGSLPSETELEAEFITVGSIGEALLEGLLMTFDFADNRVYMTQAR